MQIGSTFCKILVAIILERIRQWYEKQISDQQQGFRKVRGICDGIHIIKRIQQVSYRSEKQLFMLSVDLRAAFDHVNRVWLFKFIHQRIPIAQRNKLLNLLESVYSFTTTALSGNEEDIFNVMTGVRQGGPESPTLYNHGLCDEGIFGRMQGIKNFVHKIQMQNSSCSIFQRK